MTEKFFDSLKATGGRNLANILTQAGALTLASHLDKPIGRGIQMAGDLAGLFFGLGSPGPTGPNLAEGQSAVGIPGALGDATFNALTGEVVPTKREGGYVGKKGETVKTYAAPEGSAKPYLSAIKKVAENPNSFMGGIAQSMYDNPEVVANAVRYGTPAIGLGAAALGLHMMSKPRSDYALAVQGNPHLGSTGNANIDAAQASAYYQQQTAQMKFEHQMQLQAMRQQAQTPGVQNTGASGVPGSIPGIDTDMNQIARSIYGTGLRL